VAASLISVTPPVFGIELSEIAKGVGGFVINGIDPYFQNKFWTPRIALLRSPKFILDVM
jgi:hypothetical protein